MVNPPPCPFVGTTRRFLSPTCMLRVFRGMLLTRKCSVPPAPLVSTLRACCMCVVCAYMHVFDALYAR